jgi:hypothetical protein
MIDAVMMTMLKVILMVMVVALFMTMMVFMVVSAIAIMPMSVATCLAVRVVVDGIGFDLRPAATANRTHHWLSIALLISKFASAKCLLR